MRICTWHDDDANLAPIPFPAALARRTASGRPVRDSESTDDLLNAFATVSRHIKDLARELKCLGYFDDEDHDRPRAA